MENFYSILSPSLAYTPAHCTKASLKQYLCCRDYNFSCSKQFFRRRPLLIRLSICAATTTAGWSDVLLIFQRCIRTKHRSSTWELGCRGKNENNFHVCMTPNNWLLISFRSRLLLAVHVAFRRSCFSQRCVMFFMRMILLFAVNSWSLKRQTAKRHTTGRDEIEVHCRECYGKDVGGWRGFNCRPEHEISASITDSIMDGMVFGGMGFK